MIFISVHRRRCAGQPRLALITLRGFSAVSCTEKCALSHTKSPAKSNEGKVWKLHNTSLKICQKIDENSQHRATWNFMSVSYAEKHTLSHTKIWAKTNHGKVQILGHTFINISLLGLYRDPIWSKMWCSVLIDTYLIAMHLRYACRLFADDTH